MNTYQIKFQGTAEVETIQADSFQDNGQGGVYFYEGQSISALFKNVASVRLVQPPKWEGTLDALNTQGQPAVKPTSCCQGDITCS